MTEKEFFEEEFLDISISDIKLRDLLLNTKRSIILAATYDGLNMKKASEQLDLVKKCWGKIPENIKERMFIAPTPRFILTIDKDDKPEQIDVSVPTEKLFRDGIGGFINRLIEIGEEYHTYIYTLFIHKPYYNISTNLFEDDPVSVRYTCLKMPPKHPDKQGKDYSSEIVDKDFKLDAIGNKVYIGDNVAFAMLKYRGMQKAKVIGFSEKGVRVFGVHYYGDKKESEFNRLMHQVVKVE